MNNVNRQVNCKKNEKFLSYSEDNQPPQHSLHVPLFSVNAAVQKQSCKQLITIFCLPSQGSATTEQVNAANEASECCEVLQVSCYGVPAQHCNVTRLMKAASLGY